MLSKFRRYRSKGREAESADRAAKWVRWSSSSSTVTIRGTARTRSPNASRSRKPGTTWAPSMMTLVPSTADRSIRARSPTATAAVCSRNPTMTRSTVRVGGSRSAESASKDDVYRVGIGRDHPEDAQAGSDLRGDGRLAHAGGTADQDDQGHVQGGHFLPPNEVPGVPIAGLLVQDLDRHGVQLGRGERRDVALQELVLDPLRHLVGPIGRQPGHHHLGGHQTLRVRQSRFTVRDDDRSLLHRSAARETPRLATSSRSSGRSPSPAIVRARLSTNTTSASRARARSAATSIAAAFSSVRSASYRGARSRSSARPARSASRFVEPTTVHPWPSSERVSRGTACCGAVVAKYTIFPSTSLRGTGARSMTTIRAPELSVRTWDVRSERSGGPSSGPSPIVRTTRSDSNTRKAPPIEPLRSPGPAGATRTPASHRTGGMAAPLPSRITRPGCRA